MGTKVISFSLWGNDPKYIQGAIENARLAKEIYPGWECRFYVDREVPNYFYHAVGEFDYVRIIFRLDLDEPYINITEAGGTPNVARGDWTGMLWRFEPILEDDVEIMISRDCDSRISHREAACVNQWLESDKGFHTIHDHFHHSVPILGGLWGIKKGCLPEFGDLMFAWEAEDRWQTDQDFLTQKIWPRVMYNTMNHSEFHTNVWPGIPIPIPRNGNEFIGAAYDENNIIDSEQVKQLYG